MFDIKKDFPIFKQPYRDQKLVFLDNASTTHKPYDVVQAMTDFYSHYNANVHRGVYALAEEATMRYEEVRKQVAQHVGARLPSEIVFTKGTTEGINLVACAWALDALRNGDEIVLTQMEHHANLLPWQEVARQRGCTLKFVPVLPDGTLDYALLDTIITTKTRLVSVVQVSHVLGTHNDVSRIIARARAVGAAVLVDAAQAVPHERVDVLALDCDFLVFSGHKMMGPTGVGVLYVHQRMHDHMQPYQRGGGMVFDANYLSAHWQKMPYMLEAGTPPIAQVVGLGAALSYWNNHIAAHGACHVAQLCAYLIDGISSIKGITMMGPIDQLKTKGHLVSFVVSGMHAHDVAAYLDNVGICVRAGHHCAQPFANQMGIEASLRVSLYAYNTHQDVERVLKALRALRGF